MKICIAQINTTVGDLKGNANKVLEGIDKARQQGAELVLFPELALCGYTSEDFLLLSPYIEAARQELNAL